VRVRQPGSSSLACETAAKAAARHDVAAASPLCFCFARSSPLMMHFSSEHIARRSKRVVLERDLRPLLRRMLL
jgi:hypothetical protein